MLSNKFGSKETSIKILKFFSIAILAYAQMGAFGQQIASLDETGAVPAAAPTAVASTANRPNTVTSANWESKLDRWIEFNDVSFSSRYRSQLTSGDLRYFDNAQERTILDGRLKFDSAGRYAIGFHGSSGRSFNWAYSDVIKPDFDERGVAAGFTPYTPVQINNILVGIFAGYPATAPASRGWEFFPRQLFVSATPVDWFTAEYGSIGIAKGVSSEITTYDDDGYISGGRFYLHNPEHLYFDEIGVTYAYEGDIFEPSIFDRKDSFKHSNYHQFLFEKHYGSQVKASADYTFDKRTHTLHQAAQVMMPETKVVDSLRAEFYQRLNSVTYAPTPALTGGSGFGLTATKKFYSKVTLDAGYEQVDFNYGVLLGNPVYAAIGYSMNGDSYLTGKHVFVRANIALNPVFSLSGFYIHQTKAPTGTEISFNKQGFNGGLNIDLKQLVQHPKQVF